MIPLLFTSVDEISENAMVSRGNSMTVVKLKEQE